MKRASIGIIIVGLVLSIYYLWMMHFSGTKISSYEIGAGSGALGPIKLSSQMNTIGASLRVKYRYTVSKITPIDLSYKVTMLDREGEIKWNSSGDFWKPRKSDSGTEISSSRRALKCFNVKSTDEFIFKYEIQVHDINLKEARIELRKNVASVNKAIVLIGGLLIFSGLVMMFLSMKQIR